MSVTSYKDETIQLNLGTSVGKLNTEKSDAYNCMKLINKRGCSESKYNGGNVKQEAGNVMITN